VLHTSQFDQFDIMISSLSHKFKAPNLDEDPAGYKAFAEQLIQLRLICLGWEECSRYLRVPVRDLLRWRERNGFIGLLVHYRKIVVRSIRTNWICSKDWIYFNWILNFSNWIYFRISSKSSIYGRS
jgi:hypothetical protein